MSHDSDKRLYDRYTVMLAMSPARPMGMSASELLGESNLASRPCVSSIIRVLES